MNALSSGKKPRIFYLDLVRALAIILIILVHVLRKFCEFSTVSSANWNFSSPLMSLAIMGVPLFLMISGTLLLDRDYELGDFLKRRFTRILIPFFFWGLLLPIHKMIWLAEPWTFHNYMVLFIKEEYWYVWMLIGVYLAIPIINTFIQKYKMKGVEYFLVVWIFIMILTTLGYYPFYQLKIEYFGGYLGFLLLGYWVSNKKFSMSDKKLMLIGLLICIACIILQVNRIVTFSPVTGKITYFGYLTIVTAIQSAGLYMAFKYFCSYCESNMHSFSNKVYSLLKETFIYKIIFSLSICSYGMYLTHYFWLYILTGLSNNGIPIFQQSAKIFLPIVLVFICFMAWLVPWIFSKIPYLKEVSGAH